MSYEFIFAVLGFVGQVITLTGVVMWRLRIIESHIRNIIQEREDKTNEQINLHRRDVHEIVMTVRELVERYKHDTGEALMAIRHKITEVEMFVRDNYVRYDDLGEKIEIRLLRMESKIDKINGNK